MSSNGARWLILRSVRQAQLEDDLVTSRDIREVVRQEYRRLSPETRQRLRRAVAKRGASEVGRDLGGGTAAVSVERADGSTGRLRGHDSSHKLTKDSRRVSYSDVIRQPAWDGTRHADG